jgi:type II secretory pathway pseudopilin PulG
MVIQQEPITPTIIQVIPDKPAVEVTMIDVALAAFGVIGLIMVAAIVAGLGAGALFIWYRSRRAVTIIEERGHQHNLFRA